MSLQVLKVSAVVLAEVNDAKDFSVTLQGVLARAIQSFDEDFGFLGKRRAVTIMATASSVLPAPPETVKLYGELERQANEHVATVSEK